SVLGRCTAYRWHDARRTSNYHCDGSTSRGIRARCGVNSRLNELHRIGVAVSRETVDKLEQFESDFRKWSTRINLAAPSTLDSLWRRHILDSAQILPLAPQARKWLDLGSGGGFPGAII